MDHFQRKLASSDEGFNENMKGHAPLEEKRTIEELEREPLGHPSSTEPSQPIPFPRTPEIGNIGATVTIQQKVKDWREIKKFIEIQRTNGLLNTFFQKNQACRTALWRS